MLSALSTPDWRKAAVKARSEPASVPVWEEAARAPAAVRPDLTMTSGFRRLAALATSMKRWPFSTPSM